jgi:hypothetical protein
MRCNGFGIEAFRPVAQLTMSKNGRNDPCPSGAGVKFKKCLRQHSGLSAQSSAGAIWWVCDRWQEEAPDLGEVLAKWRELSEPDPDKVDCFLERVFAEPLESIDWERMLRECHAKHHRDLPGLYRRMSASLSGVAGQQASRLQRAAAEIFREDQPEMYADVLAATLALDPADTEMKSLEGIIRWADELERADDCERVRERFPVFPEYMLEDEDEDEGDSLVDPVNPSERNEPKFPPEIERQLDLAWDEFNAIKAPTAGDAETLLERLLELPHEATNWTEVFDVVREAKHPELFKIFDRMLSAIGPSRNRDLSFVCWGAMEEAVGRNEPERFPEIARCLRRLGPENHDPDAISHVEDYLLAHGLVDEHLDLKEQFYPALCANGSLMHWVVPQAAVEILTLRLGNLMASGGLSGTDVEPILIGLVDGIEDEIDEDLTGRLIRRLLDGPDRAKSKWELQLAINGDPVDRQQGNWVALQAAFVEVAGSHGEAGGGHPARTLIGLQMIERAAYRWIETRREKKRKFRRNLLDYLQPQNIERQALLECSEFMGVNRPRARTMLDAHKALACWAERAGILTEIDCAKITQKVDELLKEVGG